MAEVDSAPCVRGLGTRAVACFALAAIVLLAPATAMAQAAGEFYKGKQVRIVVGNPPGAGYDALGRLVGRHLGEYLPGKPNIIVSNLPGAGTLKAVQSLRVNPADGTYLVLFGPSLIPSAILDPEVVKVNFQKDVAYIGSASADVAACYSWHNSGLKTFQDVMAREKPINIGQTSMTSAGYYNVALLKNMFGAKLNVVLGYGGAGDLRLATERGEVDGSCTSFFSIPPDLIRDKKINIFVRLSDAKAPELEGVASVLDFANEEQKRIIQLHSTYNDFYYPFIVRKDVPAERLKILREAFWQTVNDKLFLDDAERTGRPVLSPLRGEDVDKLVDDLYNFPPDLIPKAAAAVKIADR